MMPCRGAKCVQLPMFGVIEILNLSVCGGIVRHWVTHHRRERKLEAEFIATCH